MREEMETTTPRGNDGKRDGSGLNVRPLLGVAILSLIICGLFFPLLVTAVGGALFPYQAGGSLKTLNGQPVGSELIAQDFNRSVFFHPRNASASGVDPDITLQDAMSQVPRISNATGISQSALQALVDANVDPAGRVVGLQYVNVLDLNLQLIEKFPSYYPTYHLSGST